jgi:hypothetical protein
VVKRIIDGVTYNTATATQVHVYYEDADVTKTLYLTRGGGFFLHWTDRSDEGQALIVMTESKAREWLDDVGADATVVLGGGSDEARVTLRLPGALHKRLAIDAAERGRSLNEHAMRLLEGEP